MAPPIIRDRLDVRRVSVSFGLLKKKRMIRTAIIEVVAKKKTLNPVPCEARRPKAAPVFLIYVM